MSSFETRSFAVPRGWERDLPQGYGLPPYFCTAAFVGMCAVEHGLAANGVDTATLLASTDMFGDGMQEVINPGFRRMVNDALHNVGVSARKAGADDLSRAYDGMYIVAAAHAASQLTAYAVEHGDDPAVELSPHRDSSFDSQAGMSFNNRSARVEILEGQDEAARLLLGEADGTRVHRLAISTKEAVYGGTQPMGEVRFGAAVSGHPLHWTVVSTALRLRAERDEVAVLVDSVAMEGDLLAEFPPSGLNILSGFTRLINFASSQREHALMLRLADGRGA